ncbi:uncharacterized protein [Littorina saxatilis]|uniref:uncharacterized protein n=1 Tax=Littorina saxatilis TaxID=31220 RepID=UPI0038B4FAAF
MASALPGSVGWPIVGDKSVDFYRDPVKFVEKHCFRCGCRIFSCRFLNTPTAFICSNAGVREVLADQDNAFELGYKPFMGQIFGDNILFTEGDEAYMFRDAMSHLFTPEAVQSYQPTVERIAKRHVAEIDSRKPMCVYKFFKEVTTEICLTLFLGIDFTDTEEAKRVVDLTTKHWHGIISVPVKFKLPGVGSESAFSSAMMAKAALLEVIKAQRHKNAEGFVKRMQEGHSDEEDVFVNNHLLLFTSALVPKAMSSILSSFAFEVAKPELASLQGELLTNDQLRSCLFKEVQRMHPPFFGGRRVAKKDTVIGGYKIPAQSAVVFMTYSAHRDPAVFLDPDTFNHKRWSSDSGTSDDKLFTFGYGPRRCVGPQVVWNIINEVMIQLLSCYNWHMVEKRDLTHKLLPVSRPKGVCLVKLFHANGPSPKPTVQSQGGTGSSLSSTDENSVTTGTSPSPTLATDQNQVSGVAACSKCPAQCQKCRTCNPLFESNSKLDQRFTKNLFEPS